jgi:hypothetical protein
MPNNKKPNNHPNNQSDKAPDKSAPQPPVSAFNELPVVQLTRKTD